jgi:hypothetical protein
MTGACSPQRPLYANYFFQAEAGVSWKMYETKGHNMPQSSEINIQIVFIIVYQGSSSSQQTLP